MSRECISAFSVSKNRSGMRTLVSRRPIPHCEFAKTIRQVLTRTIPLLGLTSMHSLPTSKIAMFGLPRHYSLSGLCAKHSNIIPKTKKPFNGLQDQKVLAAAQHILWNGQGLFKQVMYPGDVPSNGVPVPSWNAGPLYKGKPVLSLDRWQFWRKGFEASAGDSSLAEECRNVARKVANLMESLEQSMMF